MFEANTPMQEPHMTTLDPQLTTLFFVTTGIGYLMIQFGLQKSMLEWRRRKRHCPSCGRQTELCGCRS
jgi:NADH pyrophosphatase NudC (nudix superfamily)